MLFSRSASSDRVSLRLSELPRSCVSSKRFCTSWRAAAMEARKSAGLSLICAAAGVWLSALARGSRALLDGQLHACRTLGLIGLSQRFQLDDSAVAEFPPPGDRKPCRNRPPFLHRFLQRQRPAVLPVRCQRIQEIHRRQDARADGDVLALQPIRISGAIPTLVMRRGRWASLGTGKRTRSRISAPTTGWIFIFSNSSRVSFPGLEMMCSGTASFPISCNSAAARRPAS